MCMHSPATSPATPTRARKSWCRWFDAARLLGVLDVDSPRPDRFDEDDARGLEALVAQLLEGSDFERIATSRS